jgi:hypothetical protein
LCLGTGAASSPSSAAAASANAPSPARVVTTVTLSGTYSDSSGVMNSQNFCGQTYAYTIDWSETAKTTDENLDNNTFVHWKFTKLTGTSTLRPDSSPACKGAPLPPPCKAPITLRPGWEDSASGQAGISKAPEPDGVSYSYSTYGYPPYFGHTTESTCGDTTGPYVDSGGREGGPYQIRIDNLPGGQTKSVEMPVNVDTSAPIGGGGTGFRHTHGTATLTLSAGQTGVTPPTDDRKARDARKAAKVAAKADLAPAMENAKGPCLNYALGLGLFGAGSLLLGTPAVGPVLILAGSLSALAAEPFCVATITRIAKDYKIYRDPSDPRIHQVARLPAAPRIRFPACTQHNAAQRAFCLSFTPAAERWVSMAQKIAAATSALSTTVNRLTGAINRRSDSGEVTQTKRAHVLIADLAVDKAALKSAGVALARVYRKAGLRLPLSHTRVEQSVLYVLGRLRLKHVTGKQLRSVSRALLSTVAFDGLAALSAG